MILSETKCIFTFSSSVKSYIIIIHLKWRSTNFQYQHHVFKNHKLVRRVMHVYILIFFGGLSGYRKGSVYAGSNKSTFNYESIAVRIIFLHVFNYEELAVDSLEHCIYSCCCKLSCRVLLCLCAVVRSVFTPPAENNFTDICLRTHQSDVWW